MHLCDLCTSLRKVVLPVQDIVAHVVWMECVMRNGMMSKV